jgi:hypothetical protein
VAPQLNVTSFGGTRPLFQRLVMRIGGREGRPLRSLAVSGRFVFVEFVIVALQCMLIRRP